MTHEEFRQKRYSISVQAGMNQRYHQNRAEVWWRWDLAAKVTTAIFSVAGAVLSVVTIYQSDWRVVATSVALSMVAACAAIVLNVVPFGSWEQSHRELFRQWTDLREDVDAIAFEVKANPTGPQVDDLKKLEAKTHRICAQEVKPCQKLLEACFKAEERSRQFAAA